VVLVLMKTVLHKYCHKIMWNQMYVNSLHGVLNCTWIGFNGRLFSAFQRRNGQSDANISNF